MDLEDLKRVAVEAIDKSKFDLENLSHDLWKHPELGFEELYGHDRITAFLEKKGFSQIERNFVLDTGFKASFGSAERPHVVLLCEYDALPEIGHACGHNLVAELAVGAAVGIKAVIDRLEATGKPVGKVSVLGTPGELTKGGKIDMVNSGVFKDVDCAMMSHPASEGFTFAHRPGFYVASGQITADYIGKGVHNATHPWEGRNALDAAVIAYDSLAMLRQQMKRTWSFYPGIFNGGTFLGTIPDKAYIALTMRASTSDDLQDLSERIIKCLRAGASATQCEVNIDVSERGYKDIIKNQTLIDVYRKNASHLGITLDDSIPAGLETAVASTDVGNVSHEVPCIQPVFSIGTEAINHTEAYTQVAGSHKAQSHVIQQAKALALSAVDVLLNPDIVSNMWSDFHDAKH